MILQGTFLTVLRAGIDSNTLLRNTRSTRGPIQIFGIAPPLLHPDALPLLPSSPPQIQNCLPIPGHALSRIVPAPASDASPAKVDEQHLEGAVAVTAGHDIGEARMAMHGMRGAVDGADACWLLLVPPCQHSPGLSPQAAPLVHTESCRRRPGDTFLERLGSWKAPRQSAASNRPQCGGRA